MDGGEGLERQRQQLMGGGPEQMNLSSVKERAQDLQSQIMATIAELRANPGGISFDRVLERFTILNTQYDQLQRELRPQLRYHIAHPLQVDSALATLLPHQLATKVLPEMEAQEHDYLQDYPTFSDGESAIEATLLTLYRKPDAHNDTINRLVEKGAGHSRPGILHEQSQEQVAIKAASKAVQKAVKAKLDAGAAAKAAQPAGKSTSGGGPPVWFKVVQTGRGAVE